MKTTQFEEPEEWMLKRDGINIRQWRVQKRREMDALLKAANVFLCGAYYTPSDPNSDACIGEILRMANEMRERMRVKNWPLPKAKKGSR